MWHRLKTHTTNFHLFLVQAIACVLVAYFFEPVIVLYPAAMILAWAWHGLTHPAFMRQNYIQASKTGFDVIWKKVYITLPVVVLVQFLIYWGVNRI